VSEESKRVLLIAPHESYRLAPYMVAARELGIEITVASSGQYSLVSAIADGLHIEFDQPQAALDKIIEAANKQTFDAIIGTDDLSVVLASQAAQALGLAHNPPHASLISRRKDHARDCLNAAGIPVPGYRRIDLRQPCSDQCQNINFPCVVKPLALSASRGVIRVDSPEQLYEACDRVKKIIADVYDEEERNYVLIEDYLPGDEVAVDGLLDNGQLSLIMIFDKPDPLEGPFFEETYYITPSRHEESIVEKIRERVGEACCAYGLVTGPVHAECRINDEGVWMLELAARTVGGECSRLLQFGASQSLEALVLLHAVGHQHDIKQMEGAAGVLMIPIPERGILRRVEGIMAAQNVPFIESVQINVHTGYELIPAPEGSSYLGYIFARAPTPQQAEQALREAHSHLKIVTAPIFKLAAG